MRRTLLLAASLAVSPFGAALMAIGIFPGPIVVPSGEGINGWASAGCQLDWPYDRPNPVCRSIGQPVRRGDR